MMRIGIRIGPCVAVLSAALTSATAAPKYEMLIAQPEAKQYELLAVAVSSAGYSCRRVTSFLFMGSDRDDAGYWSVRCSDGEDWVVQVSNDAGGTMSVTPCSLLKHLGVICWQKF